MWREFAEHVAGSLTKGMGVMAQGRLRQRSYQDGEGVHRTAIELDVDQIGPSLRYATAQVTRATRPEGGQQDRGRTETATDTGMGDRTRGRRSDGRVVYTGQLRR